jgi:hypothetical protein
VLIKLVRANGLNKIFNCSFNFDVLGLELLGLNSDPVLLHLDELLQCVGLGVLWKVDEDGLGQALEVVLNSVLHDVVDVDDQLLELVQSLMNVGQVSINVHRSPSQSDHTWSQLVFQIFQVWDKETLCVWPDLVHDPIILSQDKLKLIVVHLELVFLEEYDLCTLWDFNSNSGQALGLSDEGKDFRVEVDIQLIVLWVTDYESGLKTGLSLLDFSSPFLSPEVFEGEESVADSIVHLYILS